MSEAPAGDGALGGGVALADVTSGALCLVQGAESFGVRWRKAGRSGGLGSGGGTLQSTLMDPRELFSLCEPQPPPRGGWLFLVYGQMS